MSDFYTENARFSRLIKFYANRLGDREAEADMWGFLYILKATKVLPNERYICVCLRNYFRKKMAEKRKYYYCPLDESSFSAYQKSLDDTLFVKTVLEGLKPAEKKAIIEHYFEELTFREMGTIYGTSPQAQSFKVKKAVLKLRDILGEK